MDNSWPNGETSKAEELFFSVQSPSSVALCLTIDLPFLDVERLSSLSRVSQKSDSEAVEDFFEVEAFEVWSFSLGARSPLGPTKRPESRQSGQL